MRLNHLLSGIVLLVGLGSLTVSVARADPKWPDTELSRHVQAWFAQMHGTEAEARAFFATHFAPAELEDTPVDVRLERRRMMIERTGGLMPIEVLESTEKAMQVRTRSGNGEELLAIIDAEATPPYRMKSVRMELGGPGGPAPAPAGPPMAEAEAIRVIRESLDREAKNGAFSGAVLLARNGKPLLRQAWGQGDRARRTPLTPETRFNLASIGKIPTRIAIARLVQAGKLSLDDKLSRFLPDFPRAGDITIDMLAEHRSGVGDFFNDRYQTMDRSKLRHNHDYLDLIRDQPFWFEPGTSMRYSNGGYALLGEVIAKASGLDYYDYLEQNVFRPAGLKATAALMEGDGTPGVARGYTHDGAPEGQERDNVATRPWRGSAAGGSYSTLDDLLALDQALVGARLCNPAWSAWVIGGARPDRGAAGDDLKSPGFGFAGGAPGISTEWSHEGELTFIIFTNRDPEVSQPIIRPLTGLIRRITP